MTFPIKELKSKNEQRENDILKQFVDANSWQEFCIKVAEKYNINCDSIFCKWKLVYIALNRGKCYVYVPIILLGIVVSTILMYLGIYCNFVQNEPTFVGTVWLFLSVGLLGYISVFKPIRLSTFIDTVEWFTYKSMYRYAQN